MLVFATVMSRSFVMPLSAAEPMPPAQQNALVHKYCAVCHTDKAKNGGLSLEHYDAAKADPPLAAMLLSKLREGAMGAAGLGAPDAATGSAWVAATAAQVEQATRWTVTRADKPDPKGATLSASIVRYVSPRTQNGESPLYRLRVRCNAATRVGEIHLTWSPTPQTDDTFFVSADGKAGTPHRLSGREAMGNGAAVTSGLASAILNVPLPENILTVSDLFPNETAVFPISELDQTARAQLAMCLAPRARL